MKTGKVSESVLKRSVLKQITALNEKVKSGAGVGMDCAVFSCGGSFAAAAVQTILLHEEREIRNGIIRAANGVAAGGAVPVLAELALTLSEREEESCLRGIMAAADKTAKELGIQIAGGHTQVATGLKEPLATVSVVGLAERSDMAFAGASPGQDIVMSKWAGLEGTALLARRYPDRLGQRYPARMVERAADLDRYLSVIPEAVAAAQDVSAMHDVSGGGIFAALWELAERAGVGLTADLKKIPIMQETVEACEYFGVSPYELLSGGCLLMTADEGEELVRKLLEEGISAAVIGRITDGNDRVVINEEERRFLERPRTDAIMKLEGWS